MDHGPVFAEARMPMDSLAADYPALERTLAELGADLLVKTIPGFFAGALKPHPQDESQATFTKKFITDDGFIKEEELNAALRGGTAQAKNILRKINAFTPEPGVWTIAADGKRVKLLKAEMKDGENGAALRLIMMQKEGGRPMAVPG
jgi:methionyl-tRNA formyltransferase